MGPLTKSNSSTIYVQEILLKEIEFNTPLLYSL